MTSHRENPVEVYLLRLDRAVTGLKTIRKYNRIDKIDKRPR